MASASLLALLDDIATVLDDVAVMTKVAAKKTAGVLGDDLALNAEQVSGVRAAREIPVVWAVAKGSALNKLIIVPTALLISIIAPWLVTILLMIGGAYLCFEGVEKVLHSFFHKKEVKKEQDQVRKAFEDPEVDMLAFEQQKIKGAIRTDFILSAEIIVIALGTVQGAPLLTKFLVLSTIATVMTVGVYGLVAGIVKLDDLGFYLLKKEGDSFGQRFFRKAGKAILAFCPWLMKALSVVGTAAMFLVGGGIIVHGVPFLHHLVQEFAHLNNLIKIFLPTLFTLVVGFIVGAIVLAIVNTVNKIRGTKLAH